SNLPGHYNALNTSAAVGVATEVQVRPIDSSDAVRKFSGIQRRFEIKFDDGQKALIDDYAHHPRELEAVIRATRELYAGRTIAVVFQPHLYSRTRDFEVEFVTSLSMADEVILLPIYPARELPIEGVSSANLLKKLPLKTKALVEKSDLVIAVLSLTAQVVLMLGAGDIDQLVDPVAEAFAN
ncbi:MAG: UDP-N-acetylmuramate--L-alanine ligase, partial [Flavobacteriales bacterium]|nr:UDP-N-acetylmuramate--L-alanine ligase [Flavobacteriales bacterium]